MIRDRMEFAQVDGARLRFGRLFLAVAWMLAALTGCQPDERGSTSTRIACESGCFDYAGTYTTAIELVANGGEPAYDEYDVLVQQNGPAVLVANILAVADEQGLYFGHEWDGIDYWVGERIHVEYSGASRPGDPFVLDLRIEQTYPDLDGWGLTYEYVLTLGERVEM